MHLKIEDARREEGFTLIELLVVVIIIGILAAIAIPVFLNQRRSAWQGELTSGVRNTALEVEAAATISGGNYSTLPGEAEHEEYVQALMDEVLGQVDAEGDPRTVTVGDADLQATGFGMCATHVQLVDGDAPDLYVVYSTWQGGVQTPVEGDCPDDIDYGDGGEVVE